MCACARTCACVRGVVGWDYSPAGKIHPHAFNHDAVLILKQWDKSHFISGSSAHECVLLRVCQVAWTPFCAKVPSSWNNVFRERAIYIYISVYTLQGLKESNHACNTDKLILQAFNRKPPSPLIPLSCSLCFNFCGGMSAMTVCGCCLHSDI